MWFLNYIIELLNDITQMFYYLYSASKDFGWPFNLLSAPFYNISAYFARLASYFRRFNYWVEDADNKLRDLLSLDELRDYFQTWIDYATWAYVWVFYAVGNVTDIVDNWWTSVQFIVLLWIEQAKQEARDLFNQLSATLMSLRMEWEQFRWKIPSILEVLAWFWNWTSNVTSVINTWWNNTLLDVLGLIDTAFLEREPLWAGWQDFRDKVAEFFADPLEFLLTLFTDWFLGPEA